MPTFTVKVAGFLSTALFLLVFVLQRHALRRYRRLVGDFYTTDDASISPHLMKDLHHMIGIALPNVWSREGLGSMLFIFLFGVKSALRVAQSTVDGDVLTTMVLPRHIRPTKGAYRSLRAALLAKVSVSLLASVVSGAIEHIRHWLITEYRDRLTKYFHDRFYQKLVYYHGTVLDERIDKADTVIAEYCGEFAEHFAELPYYFVLPFLEASTSLVALAKQSGSRSAAVITSVVLCSVAAVNRVSPPFGRIHAAVLRREDDFRKMHANAIVNVEQVALHNAGELTKKRLNAEFGRLKLSLHEMSLAKGHFELLEGAIDTVWGVAAYAICSVSSRVGGGGARTKSERLSDAVVQLRLIRDFNTSVKCFVLNTREVSHLSEFTTKLTRFDEILEEIVHGRFVRHQSPVTSPSHEAMLESPAYVKNPSHPPRSPSLRRLSQLRESEDASSALIQLTDVDVRNPSGSLLVSQLTLAIRADHNWAIVGPNGCGKTSVLRVLAKLWPCSGGGVLKVKSSVVFCFLPQNPYLLPCSTMMEQVCFPDEPDCDEGPMSSSCARVSLKEQTIIREALARATATEVLEHLGGWSHPVVGLEPEVADRTFDWSSLSGGQRQKLALSRVFYHARKASMVGRDCVAVLDESTSMMDHDAEQCVYENLKEINAHFISVTHREEVLCHHTHILLLSRDPYQWDVTMPSLYHEFLARTGGTVPASSPTARL